MHDEERTADEAPAERKPWTKPTLETHSIADETEVGNGGGGFDGGGVGASTS